MDIRLAWLLFCYLFESTPGQQELLCGEYQSTRGIEKEFGVKEQSIHIDYTIYLQGNNKNKGYDNEEIDHSSKESHPQCCFPRDTQR